MTSNKAILALIEAKPEYVSDVEGLLVQAIALANQEQGTKTWFSFKLSEYRFGIFDTFADEQGREAHLNGKIAEALLSKADLWLTCSPNIAKADVLAAKH